MPRSLAARIGIAMMLVGLLPVLVVWGTTTIIESRRPNLVDQYLVLISDYAAQSVRQDLEETTTAISMAARDEIVRDNSNRAAVENRLQQFNDLYPLFRHLTLVDLSGRVLASSTDNYWREWRGLKAFQQAKTGQVIVSAAHLPIGDSEPMISLAAPVYDQGGEITGVLVGEVPVASVAPPVVRLQVGKEGHAFLVNSIGQVIAHQDAERLMENWDISSLEPRTTGGLFRALKDGRDYLYAIALVKTDRMQEDWKVVLQIPRAEAHAYLARTQHLTLFISVAIIIIIIVDATILALSISQPVRQVTIAARRMAAGELGVRVEASSGGELGELASSFNSMAQELQAKVEALKESRSRIVTAQEGVRREIASHLHGRVQGKLLALKGQLQEILRDISPSSATAHLLNKTVDSLKQITEAELSVLSRRLYPSILRRGLVPALQSLGDQFLMAQPIEMKLDEELVRQENANRNLIPERLRLAAHRIAEEALANVVKHAGANQVTLSLELLSPGGLRLTVRDNGQGFNMNGDHAGLGMTAMQDYAEAVGGNCIIRSLPGQGTEVTATLPIIESGAPHPGKAST